jgi:hypothetical protein
MDGLLSLFSLNRDDEKDAEDSYVEAKSGVDGRGGRDPKKNGGK